MVPESGNIDHWRHYFKKANSCIFDVIENAILVAATDCPKEFCGRRGRIVENLFSCSLARCSGCKQVELQRPGGEEQDDGLKGGAKGDKEEEYKVDRPVGDWESANQMVSNLSFDEAEALTNEMEDECQAAGEVLRIKAILANQLDESEAVLFDSLRRLQLMALSYDTLKVTEIGKVVNTLRKHGSKRIRHIVRTLIDEWKVTVDEWIKAAAAIAECTPESVNPSSTVDEEEGLVSPPLDDLAFFTTGTGIMELSQFFDGMDDCEDGNIQNMGEFGKDSRDKGRKPMPRNQSQAVRKLPQISNGLSIENGDVGKKPISEEPSNPLRKLQKLPQRLGFPKDNSQIRKQDVNKKQTKENEVIESATKHQGALETSVQQQVFNKQKKLFGIDSGSGYGRPIKPHEPALVQKNAREKQQTSDEIADRKLEAAKRRLHENYLLAESAKKQRTIQVMELHDIPKQGMHHQRHQKQVIKNRRFVSGRAR